MTTHSNTEFKTINAIAEANGGEFIVTDKSDYRLTFVFATDADAKKAARLIAAKFGCIAKFAQDFGIFIDRDGSERTTLDIG